MPRPDWSRPLPRPLVIPTVLNLVTLDDVRSLIERHLPMRIREKPTWGYIREKLAEAARSGNMTDVVVALQIALHLEGVECPPGLTPRRFPRLSISLSNESGQNPVPWV